MLPFQRRQNIPTAIASDEFEIVEISPRIAKLANVPSRQAHVQQPHAHSRVFSLSPSAATAAAAVEGERSNIWPASRSRKHVRPSPPHDDADRSLGATVVTNAQARALAATGQSTAQSTGHVTLERPTLSWAAGGLVASAILALGILVGIVVTVVGHGADTDPNYDANAAITNPSPAQAAGSQGVQAGQPLPPPFPVQPPMALVAPPVTRMATNAVPTNSGFAPVVIGKPVARGGVPTVSVEDLPRAGATGPAAPAPRSQPRWASSAPRRKATTTSSSPAPAAAPAPRAKSSGDPDLDAANATLARGNTETEVALH